VCPVGPLEQPPFIAPLIRFWNTAAPFADPLAMRILGVDADSIARKVEQHTSGRRMRIFIAARTRFAEDALAAAVERGVRRLVVLGAGLDTYAYRGLLRNRLRIFEVDHSATQAWKRKRLAEASIPLPPALTFAPIDFEHQALAAGLAAVGFDSRQPAFFTWLGLVPYLTEEAIWSTFGFIASLPNGAHLVFDYANPTASLSPDDRSGHDRRAAHVAELGEPWVNYFETDPLYVKLTGLGFIEIEDLGPSQIAARYCQHRVDSAPETGGHILRAATI
jgi:methyltransferase (TIGR00027 family)